MRFSRRAGWWQDPAGIEGVREPLLQPPGIIARARRATCRSIRWRAFTSATALAWNDNFLADTSTRALAQSAWPDGEYLYDLEDIEKTTRPMPSTTSLLPPARSGAWRAVLRAKWCQPTVTDRLAAAINRNHRSAGHMILR